MEKLIVSNKKKKKSFNFKNFVGSDQFWAYLFIAPVIISFLVFNLVSIIGTFGISFTDWRAIKPPNFIGLSNYQSLFSDSVFPKALLNTGIFTFVSVPIGIILALLLANALNQKIRALPVFRVMYYIPAISASVAVSMVWMWIFSSSYGILNYLLSLFGIARVDWLNNTKTVLLAVTAVEIWRGLGYKTLILLAGLQNVPRELIEASEIDGANWWTRFTRVTIPLIGPSIFFISVTSFIQAMQNFDLVYNMRFEHDGGPARATTTLAFYLYQVAFEYLRIGYGSAIACALFIIMLAGTYIQWRARKRLIYAEE